MDRPDPDLAADALTGADPLPPPPPDLEARLGAATALRVRGRAHRRAAVALLALLGAYGAGLASGTFVAPAGRPAPSGDPAPAEGAARPAPAPFAPDAEAREMAERLRRRGDRLLAEAGDVEGAIACYREHLELASRDGAPATDPSDTWLLAALKTATP